MQLNASQVSSDPCFSGRRKAAALGPCLRAVLRRQPPAIWALQQGAGSPYPGHLAQCSGAAPHPQQQSAFKRGSVAGFAASAALSGGGSGPDAYRAESILQAAARFAAALYQFSRPHTMIGTTISIVSMSLLACGQAAVTSSMVTGLVQALVAALLMNISIVGTNQIYDIDIDKVNKPYLPLASGEWSVETGWAVVAGATALSFLVGWASGSPALMTTLVVSWLLGLVYSIELPFMRWKRSPVLAATCILSIRAIAVQLGFYWHMRHCMASPDALQAVSWAGVAEASQHLPIPVVFTVSFMLLFSIVIALFKDIPDASGDRGAGIRTLTVRMGAAVPFWACIWILTAAYVGACGYSVVTASMLPQHSGLAMASPASLSLVPTLPAKALVSIFGHGVMAVLLWWRALKVDLSKKEDITSCYMHIWKLFYAEYLLIPLFA